MFHNRYAGAPGYAAQVQSHPHYAVGPRGEMIQLAGGQLAQVQAQQISSVPSVAQVQQTSLFRYGETTHFSTFFWPGGTAVASSSPRWFSTQIGQVGQGFTLPLSSSETNILVGGMLPLNQALDVYGIAFQPMFASAATDVSGTSLDQPCVTNDTITDLLSIQQNLLLKWAFSQTQIDIAVVELIGAGGGTFGAVSTTQNATDRGHMNNGNATVWLYRDFGVTLPGTTAFAIQGNFGSRAAAIGTNGVAARVVLLGQYKSLIDVA